MIRPKVIDLYPDEHYSSIVETHPITTFNKIPKPIKNKNKDLRTLISLKVGEMFTINNKRRTTVCSWVHRHGKTIKRRFVTRSFDNRVEIYRVE